MAEQNFYDMTDTAENIDRVIHDLVEVVTEENDGKVLMVEKVVDEETDEVSVNIVEADLPVLEGNRNEIIAFDGEGWGEQTGVYAYETNKTFFDYYLRYRYFKIWNSDDNSDIDLRGVKIIDVTDDEEVIVYDMQTDANFSSISKTKTSITPLYIGSSSEYTLNVTPVNSITIKPIHDMNDRYRNLTRYVGIDMSQFDILSRKYRIEIEAFKGRYVCLNLISPSDQTGIPLVAGAFNQGSDVGTITYTPSDITKTIKTLHSDCSEFSIEGGGLFSISQGSRLTMHGGRADINQDAELYLHDKARFNMDSGAQLFLHDGSWVTADGDARMHLHDGSWVTADGEARMHLHDKSILTMGDCAKVYIQGNDNKGADGKGARVILNGDSRFYMQSVGADSPEMALNGGSKFYMNGGYRDTGNYDPYMAISDKQIFINGNGSSPEGAWPTLAISDCAKVYVDGEVWVKVGDSAQIHMLDNSFTQMSGNSHSEMHNDSFFIMKNRPENSKLESKARDLYFEATNYAIGRVIIRKNKIDSTGKSRAEVKTINDGTLKCSRSNMSGSNYPALYDSSGTWLDGGLSIGDMFSFNATADTSYFAGTYGNASAEYNIVSDTPFIIVRQGIPGAPVINELHELPEPTGILWEDLTEAEKLVWYKKADNGHEKVEGSPFFQMANNSSIDLDDGIDITGDSSGLYLNNEKIATEYSYETEEEGETILNTVNIEKLFTELQSALVRIAELEETIQTLNP